MQGPIRPMPLRKCLENSVDWRTHCHHATRTRCDPKHLALLSNIPIRAKPDPVSPESGIEALSVNSCCRLPSTPTGAAPSDSFIALSYCQTIFPIVQFLIFHDNFVPMSAF
jgi:hypothetical protein